MRIQILTRALAISLSGVSLSACLESPGIYTGASDLKRSTVTSVRISHDIQLDETGWPTVEGAKTLVDFITRHGVGHGDIVSLDIGNGDEVTRGIIGDALAKHGVWLNKEPIAWGKTPEANTARLVMDRYVAKAPDCTQYPGNVEKNVNNIESANFACSSQTILGMMVANKRDLVRGQNDSAPDAGKATSAVSTFTNRKTGPAPQAQKAPASKATAESGNE
jgi:type IV pilus biogenesis protein CpaD/CtpE